jgi:hypothetical protein
MPKMAEAATQTAQKYREMIWSYQDLVIRQKGSVLTMFNATRKQTDDFLRSNGIGQAQTLLDQAKAALDYWISGLPPRVRDDGATFRSDVNPKLDIVFKRTKDLDDQFKANSMAHFFHHLATKPSKRWRTTKYSRNNSTRSRAETCPESFRTSRKSCRNR